MEQRITTPNTPPPTSQEITTLELAHKPSYFMLLPGEIIGLILLYLDVSSIVQLSRVCTKLKKIYSGIEAFELRELVIAQPILNGYSKMIELVYLKITSCEIDDLRVKLGCFTCLKELHIIWGTSFIDVKLPDSLEKFILHFSEATSFHDTQRSKICITPRQWLKDICNESKEYMLGRCCFNSTKCLLDAICAKSTIPQSTNLGAMTFDDFYQFIMSQWSIQDFYKLSEQESKAIRLQILQYWRYTAMHLPPLQYFYNSPNSKSFKYLEVTCDPNFRGYFDFELYSSQLTTLIWNVSPERGKLCFLSSNSHNWTTSSLNLLIRKDFHYYNTDWTKFDLSHETHSQCSITFTVSSSIHINFKRGTVNYGIHDFLRFLQ